MTWWDIIKFENKLEPLIDALKQHHTTSGKMNYVPEEKRRDFLKLYAQFMKRLQDPDIDLGNLNELSMLMERYYSKLVDAPEFHHREFGILYDQVFDALREIKRLGGEGDGI